MYHKKQTYRQGIVNTDENLNFKKGQIVNILFETQKEFLIQIGNTSKPEFVKKEDISL